MGPSNGTEIHGNEQMDVYYKVVLHLEVSKAHMIITINVYEPVVDIANLVTSL